MPREGKQRKKTRTHVDESKLTSKIKVPQCIIARQGKVGQSVSVLVEDLREIMMPNTAKRLKERRRTSIKEYIRFGVPMGATHLMLFAQTDTAVNARIACLPRGPTLTLRVREFALASDVRNSHRRVPDLSGLFRTAPLVLLNNFDTSKPELKLASVTLQNMFPTLAVATVKLSDCQRCVLFSYEAGTGLIHMRHYAIQTKASAASRSIRRVIKDRIPNLSHLEDISEFVLGKAGADGGATSESEAEEEAVTLPKQLRSRRGPRVQRAALKMVEIGPRCALEVVKVQRGVCEGDVLYHKFEKKSPQEAAELKRKARERLQLRSERRAQQEENVRRKKEEAERQAEERRRRREEKRRAALAAAGHVEGAGGEEGPIQLEDIDGADAGDADSEEGSEADSEPDWGDGDAGEGDEEDDEDDDGDEDDEDEDEEPASVPQGRKRPRKRA